MAQVRPDGSVSEQTALEAFALVEAGHADQAVVFAGAFFAGAFFAVDFLAAFFTGVLVNAGGNTRSIASRSADTSPS